MNRVPCKKHENNIKNVRFQKHPDTAVWTGPKFVLKGFIKQNLYLMINFLENHYLFSFKKKHFL